MNISFQCGKCGKQLSAKPELAGKRVKCPQCGEPAAVPAGAPPPKPAVPAHAGHHAAAYSSPPGMPAQGMPPPGAHAPAMPHMGSLADLLDDSGPGKLVEATVFRHGEAPCPGCGEPVPMNAAICVKCGLDLRGGKTMGTRVKRPMSEGQKKTVKALLALCWMLLISAVSFGVLVGFIALWIGFELVSRELPYYQVSIGLMVMAGSFAILNWFSMVADAFQEGWGRGLAFLLLPFYAIFWIATHWSTCWKNAMWYLIASHIFVAGLLMYLSLRAWRIDHPPPPNYEVHLPGVQRLA